MVVVTKSEGEMDPTVEDKLQLSKSERKYCKVDILFYFIFRGEGQRKDHELLIFGLSNILHDCITEKF